MEIEPTPDDHREDNPDDDTPVSWIQYRNAYLKYVFEERAGSIGYLENIGTAFASLTEYFTKRVIKLPPLVTREDIQSFRDWMIREGGLCKSSIQNYLSNTKRFFDWAKAEGHIASSPFAEGPVPVRGKSSPKRFLLSPDLLFAIRTSPMRVNLDMAMAFEWYLCTGMRLGEGLQVRMNQIKIGDRPWDCEDKGFSSYFGGSYLIDPAIMHTKSAGRKVYLSKICLKLLHRYTNHYGIPLISDHPLFPIAEVTMKYWFREMWKRNYNYLRGKGLLDEVLTVRPREVSTVNEEEISDLPSTDKFKRRLRARKVTAAKEKIKSDLYQDELNIDKLRAYNEELADTREQGLHAHAMRHAFAAFNFHRNCFGERHSLERLRVLMGHNQSNQTSEYLSGLRWESVLTDDQWKSIMLGKPGDWRMAFQ